MDGRSGLVALRAKGPDALAKAMGFTRRCSKPNASLGTIRAPQPHLYVPDLVETALLQSGSESFDYEGKPAFRKPSASRSASACRSNPI